MFVFCAFIWLFLSNTHVFIQLYESLILHIVLNIFPKNLYLENFDAKLHTCIVHFVTSRFELLSLLWFFLLTLVFVQRLGVLVSAFFRISIHILFSHSLSIHQIFFSSILFFFLSRFFLSPVTIGFSVYCSNHLFGWFQKANVSATYLATA